MRDMQTELLKAFLYTPYREQAGLRDAALEERQSAVEARFHSVERRPAEIEKKLLLSRGLRPDTIRTQIAIYWPHPQQIRDKISLGR